MQELEFPERRKSPPMSAITARHFSPDMRILAHKSKPASSVYLASEGGRAGHQSLIVQSSKDLLSGRRSTDASSLERHCMEKVARKNSDCIQKGIFEGEDSANCEEENEQHEDEGKIRVHFEDYLRECPNKLEDHMRIVEKQRTASLDHIRRYGAITSPRLASMRKPPAAFPRQAQSISSPGTPSYSERTCNLVGFQDDGNSDHAPPKVNLSRRDGIAAIFPLSKRRSLPSKWENAEKWVTSSLPGEEGANRPPLIPPPQRRPISKSGPMYGFEIANHSSPPSASTDGRVGNFTRSSALTAGVLIPNGMSGQVIGVAGRASCPVLTERGMVRSASVEGWSDRAFQRSLPKYEKEGTVTSSAISRRDIGTQTSPVHRESSTPEERHFCYPLSLSVIPTSEPRGSLSSKLEVKDVQVDDHSPFTNTCYQGGSYEFSTNIREGKRIVESTISKPEVTGAEKRLPRIRRDAASIMAWEAMQKAKAESEIRKLEVKLEKMRTSSMNKIINKMRITQRKVQEMRNSVLESQVYVVSSSNRKADSFCKTCQMSSITGCVPATPFSCIFTLNRLKQRRNDG